MGQPSTMAGNAANFEQLNIPLSVVLSVVTAAFSVGGFYLVTLFRIKRLEKKEEDNKDVKERLVRIETSIEFIKENIKPNPHP